jgi:hypothetical protein
MEKEVAWAIAYGVSLCDSLTMKIKFKNWCSDSKNEGWQIAFLPHLSLYCGKGPTDKNGYCLCGGWLNLVVEFWWGDTCEN